jgi:hypothetical protein
VGWIGSIGSQPSRQPQSCSRTRIPIMRGAWLRAPLPCLCDKEDMGFDPKLSILDRRVMPIQRTVTING